MKDNSAQHIIASSGVEDSAQFGISLDDSSHIMTMLRDTLYTDKVSAVLREYGANAWDAHRDAGKADLPIRVTLPTDMDPTLRIRDFGPGLRDEDVLQIYTQYGRSTKRTNNNTVGSFGIGCKSAFSYSDSFTVTSWHGSFKRVYVAVLDSSNKGLMNRLLEEPCDPHDTGIEIQVAIRPRDIKEFTKKAKALYQYFVPHPSINTDLPELPEGAKRLQHGFLWEKRHDSDDWTAVMGCIPYRVNVSQLASEGIPNYVHKISGCLNFDIGDVEISASREELKYSDATKAKLVAKIVALVDEYVTNALHDIVDSSVAPWDRRIRAKVLVDLGLPIPASLNDEIGSRVYIKDFPKSFSMHRADQQERTSTIMVDKNVRLLIHDINRSMRGYALQMNDYVIKPINPVSPTKVVDDLDAMLKAHGLTGISIDVLSNMPWSKPLTSRSGKSFNIKHHLKAFKLDPAKMSEWPYSNRWVPVAREPEEDDVFVILQEFKTDTCDVYYGYQKIASVYQVMGLQMPDIYGYKTTAKHPIAADDCEGTEFKAWFDTQYPKHMASQVVIDTIQAKCYAELYESYDSANTSMALAYATKLLGPQHAVTKLLSDIENGHDFINSFGHDRDIQTLWRGFNGTNNANLAVQDIVDTYPLLSGHRSLQGRRYKDWIQYVALYDAKDSLIPAEPKEEIEEKHDDAA